MKTLDDAIQLDDAEKSGESCQCPLGRQNPPTNSIAAESHCTLQFHGVGKALQQKPLCHQVRAHPDQPVPWLSASSAAPTRVGQRTEMAWGSGLDGGGQHQLHFQNLSFIGELSSKQKKPRHPHPLISLSLAAETGFAKMAFLKDNSLSRKIFLTCACPNVGGGEASS